MNRLLKRIMWTFVVGIKLTDNKLEAKNSGLHVAKTSYKTLNPIPADKGSW